MGRTLLDKVKCFAKKAVDDAVATVEVSDTTGVEIRTNDRLIKKLILIENLVN
jgi:hypothetical protein